MSAPEGTFIWYELMTTDPAAAKAFYTQVIGWGAEQAAAPNDAYTLFTVAGPGTGRAGLMAIPPEAKAGGARPAWLGYVAVRDVDETAARVQRDGGPVEEIRPGDVVWFPPGEKHWHGAAATTAMSHIAIQEKLNGSPVDWLEHVTDEQYESKA